MQIKNINTDTLASYLQRLSDVRNIGQYLFVALVLLISWSGVKTIQTNYGLQKQIAALNQENTVHKLENENLALQNEYFKSRQYLELAARQNFGLAMPGEKVVIVPPSVALSYTVDLPTETKVETGERKRTTPERNFTKWLDFFLHRNQGN